MLRGCANLTLFLTASKSPPVLKTALRFCGVFEAKKEYNPNHMYFVAIVTDLKTSKPQKSKPLSNRTNKTGDLKSYIVRTI